MICKQKSSSMKASSQSPLILKYQFNFMTKYKYDPMAIFWDSEKDIFDNGTGIEISDKEAKDFLKIAYLLAQTELDGTMKKINEFELIEKKQYDELKRKNDDLKEQGEKLKTQSKELKAYIQFLNEQKKLLISEIDLRVAQQLQQEESRKEVIKYPVSPLAMSRKTSNLPNYPVVDKKTQQLPQLPAIYTKEREFNTQTTKPQNCMTTESQSKIDELKNKLKQAVVEREKLEGLLVEGKQRETEILTINQKEKQQRQLEIRRKFDEFFKQMSQFVRKQDIFYKQTKSRDDQIQRLKAKLADTEDKMCDQTVKYTQISEQLTKKSLKYQQALEKHQQLQLAINLQKSWQLSIQNLLDQGQAKKQHLKQKIKLLQEESKVEGFEAQIKQLSRILNIEGQIIGSKRTLNNKFLILKIIDKVKELQNKLIKTEEQPINNFQKDYPSVQANVSPSNRQVQLQTLHKEHPQMPSIQMSEIKYKKQYNSQSESQSEQSEQSGIEEIPLSQQIINVSQVEKKEVNQLKQQVESLKQKLNESNRGRHFVLKKIEQLEKKSNIAQDKMNQILSEFTKVSKQIKQLRIDNEKVKQQAFIEKIIKAQTHINHCQSRQQYLDSQDPDDNQDFFNQYQDSVYQY